MIPLKRLRSLEARYDGPIPPAELAAGDLERGRALAMREHHRTHAAAAIRRLRRGRLDAGGDLTFHIRQFRRWNRYLWRLKSPRDGL